MEQPAQLPGDDPRLRLSRVQASHPGAPYQEANGGLGDRLVRGLPGPSGGPPRRVHHAVQHHPDQRHRLLPRPRGLGCVRNEVVPDRVARRRPGRADPGMERGLRVRARRRTRMAMVLAEALGADEFRRAGQDLRHRRGRGCAHRGAPRRSTPPARVEAVPPELLERYFDPRTAGTSSARTCGGRSSSAATISCRMRRSRASICWSAATPSCTSTRRRRRGSSAASISRSHRAAYSSWARRRCC